MGLIRVWIPSPNWSNRNSPVRLIVLHTAQGARTFQSLGSFFSNSSSGVSSHTGIDDTLGTIGEYVKRPNKAWTQAAANPYSIATELCAFAEWNSQEWQRHPNMLENASQWIAEEAAYFGIPIRRLTAQQAQDGKTKGVCQHVDLGSAGGNHWDCGPNFPMDSVLSRANQIASGDAGPVNQWSDDMVIQEPDGKIYWCIYNGPNTYWRPLDAGPAAKIPTAQIIKDDGSLLRQWKIGANG